MPALAKLVLGVCMLALLGYLVDWGAVTAVLRRADLVVPLHTARRLLSRPGPAGFRLSVDAGLPRSAFSPRPSVDVTVLTIRPMCNH